MSKIIKHGDKRKYTYITTCPQCGCVFEYDNHDILPTFPYHSNPKQIKYDPTIQCPDCSSMFTASLIPIQEMEPMGENSLNY